MFLDLKKAYDLVPHKRLIAKIKRAGYGPRLTKFIENMYKETKCRVRVQNMYTEPFEYQRGVRQGCPTSPDLFNLYINDMLDDQAGITVPGLKDVIKGLHFADDTVIFGETKEDIEQSLVKIKEWCEKNCMEINVSKCGLMKFRRVTEENPEAIKVLYGQEEVPETKHYEYLGVKITESLSYDSMAKHREANGNRIVGMCKHVLLNDKIALKYKSMIVKNIIVPTITYGGEIFGCNETRVKKLKAVLDSAVACIVKKSNFVRSRVHEEMRVKTIGMIMATARSRAINKWRESNKWIGDLIRNPITKKVKGVPLTWLSAGLRWIARTKVKVDEDPREFREKITEYYYKRNKEKEKADICNLANENNFMANNLMKQKRAYKEIKHEDMHQVFRFKCGAITWTPELKTRGTLHIESNCLGCNKGYENPLHFLFFCEEYADIREKTIGTNRRLQEMMEVPNKFISLAKYITDALKRRR